MIDLTAAALAAYAMFGMALLLVGVVYSRLHWALKSGLVLASLAVAGMSFVTYREARGFPVAGAVPPEAVQLLGHAVREPTPGDPGRIVVWIQAPRAPEPRAIVLPYSRETHKGLTKAQGRMQKGEAVFIRGNDAGEAEDARGGGSRPPGEQGNGRGQGRGSTGGGQGGPISFVDPPGIGAPKREY